MVSIDGQVVLVTGGNRGLGRAFVAEALARGAAKVYATSRTGEPWGDPRVVAIALEVTDAEAVAGLVDQAPDVSVLINNAGIAEAAPLVSGDLAAIRRDLEVDLFGPLLVTRALAPALAAHDGGAILNVHSVLSWAHLSGSNSVAKAALWAATNSIRLELAGQGTHVVGLHVGYIDTDMAATVTAAKNAPADVARAGLDAIESGAVEVVVDDLSRTVKAGLAADPAELYAQLTR
ncbi:SDR family oxidoreductase [Microbacteriaceae bacterium VKM Ac-2855]|nr:SDR family oxidoreductase [Microbacteriaceae bacterium VKM Ac-2855]